MATTTNYSWTTPDDTDLVKDGASAIRTLGSAIDTTVFNNAGAAVAKSTIDAKGDLLVGTANDTVGRLAVGTDGFTLVADSVETTGLKWAAPSSGSMTSLATGTLSGASVSITSINGTYRDLRLVITAYKPANDGASLFIRFNSDSGANRYRPMSATVADSGTFYDNLITIAGGQDNGTDNGLIVATVPEYANTTSWKLIYADAIVNDFTTATSVAYGRRVGVYNQTAAITEISIHPSTGNFTSGTYTLYGVK